MKKIILTLLLISSITAFSQESTWLSSYEEAAKISKETNKPILANFTGSDWCGWCKVLNKEVFKTDEFKTWASENVVLLVLDFPKRKKLSEAQKIQNYTLQKAFGVRGYPTIILFNPGKGKDPKKDMVALGKTGYVKGGASKWIASIAPALSK